MNDPNTYQVLTTCLTCGGPFNSYAYGTLKNHCRACEMCGLAPAPPTAKTKTC